MRECTVQFCDKEAGYSGIQQKQARKRNNSVREGTSCVLSNRFLSRQEHEEMLNLPASREEISTAMRQTSLSNTFIFSWKREEWMWNKNKNATLPENSLKPYKLTPTCLIPKSQWWVSLPTSTGSCFRSELGTYLIAVRLHSLNIL